MKTKTSETYLPFFLVCQNCRSCSHFVPHIYIPYWNFQLRCLNSLQICPLSETRKGDSFPTSPWRAWQRKFFIYSRSSTKRMLNAIFLVSSSSALCCAKNASPRARLSTRKIFSSEDWLLPNPLGTPRYVGRSKNNLRVITCGIRLVWGMDSLPW